MLREWAEHSLKLQDRRKQEFLDRLDEIILNQIRRILCRQEMPTIMQGVVKTPLGTERTPFAKHPLLGHMSIYSMNLITLRTILSPDGYRFAEDGIDTHEDGSRPWDQLTHMWRSWFSLDNLNGLTAILSAVRDGSQVRVTPRDAFRISTSSSRLEMVFNVSAALADNVTTGLAGLLNYNASHPEPGLLDDIQKGLDAEGIDLKLQLAVKRLVSQYDDTERALYWHADDPTAQLAAEVFERASEAGRFEELRTLLGVLWRQRDTTARWPSLGRALHPGMVVELLQRAPQIGICFLAALIEGGTWGDEHWSLRHEHLLERVLHPRTIMAVMERWPDAGIEMFELLRRTGLGWPGRSADDWPAPLLDELRDLAARKPESAVGMLSVVDDLEPAAERMVTELVERLDPGDLAGIVYRQPVAGSRLIRMLRKHHRKPVPQEKMRDLFDENYLQGLIMRRPEAAVEVLHLLEEVAPRSAAARVAKDLFRRFDPRDLGQVVYRDPIAGGQLVSLLYTLALESKARAAEGEWVDRFMHPREMELLIWRRQDGAAELLGLVLDMGPSPWSQECLRLLMDQAPGFRSLLRKIPVGAAHQLKSLADKKKSTRLASEIEAVLLGD